MTCPNRQLFRLQNLYRFHLPSTEQKTARNTEEDAVGKTADNGAKRAEDSEAAGAAESMVLKDTGITETTRK